MKIIQRIIAVTLLMLIPLNTAAKSIRFRYPITPPLGGLNTNVNPINLDPNMLIKANNIIYDLAGTRIKRGGTLKLNSTAISANAITGMFDFRKIATNGTETRKIIAHCGTKIYKMDSYDGVWDDISNTVLTADRPEIDYAVLRRAQTTTDTVVMVNGANIPQYWNQGAATVADLTDPPHDHLAADIDFYPSCIETHKFRLFAAGVPSYPYRVFYSKAFDFDNWTLANDAGYVDLIDSEGGKITGIVGGYYDYLVVFTDSSIHRISGSTGDATSTDVFYASPFQTQIGAINNAGIVPFGNDIFFVSKKGIHSLVTTEKYGNVREMYLSAPIQDDFNALNANRLKYCCGQAWPELNYLIWSFSDTGSSTNNICFVYDYIGKRWSTWDGINAACFAKVRNTSSDDVLLAGNYAGYANRLNRADYNDNGVAYTMMVTTPYLNMGDPVMDKTFKELFVFLKPQGTNNLDVLYRVDSDDYRSLEISQAGTGNVLGGLILGTDRLGGGQVVVRNKPLVGQGKVIQFTFESSDVDIGCEIYSYVVEGLKTDTDYSN